MKSSNNKVVLSLLKDTHRRKNFFEQLSNLKRNDAQIDFSTFYAIDASEEKSKLYIDSCFDFVKAEKLYGRKISYGEAACALSHIEIYKQLLNQEIENYGIICEDDAKFNPDFPVLINILDKNNFDIVIFGESKAPSFKGSLKYRFAYPLQFKPKRFSHYSLGCIWGFYTPGTVGYSISRKALLHIVKFSNEEQKIYWLADDFDTIIKNIKNKYNYTISLGHLFPRLVIEDSSICSHLENERFHLQQGAALGQLSVRSRIKHTLILAATYFYKKLIAYNMSKDLK